MNGRQLSDAQISRALQAHLPERAAAGLRERVLDAAGTTTQQRPLPSFLGALTDADPVARRTSLLIAAALLLGLLLASAAAAGGLRLLDSIRDVSLEPPGPNPAFVQGPLPSQPTLTPTPSVEASASTSPAVPSPGGVWIATGAMGTTRNGHTAVRLLDGRVLVAGGYPGDEPDLAVTSAELYNPESGTWSATGNMLKPHAGFGATLLRDGRVLVGDVDDPAADKGVAGAEVYDPATGTWTVTGKMVRDVGGDAKATLLRDGKVLVTAYGAADLYDPDSGTWSSTGKMVGPAAQHAAVLLADGRVLVVKGDHLAPSAELYDPATGTWSAIADMHASYSGVGATLMRDGKVLVLGSQFNGPVSGELYDPSTGAWTTIGVVPATSVRATLLSDGKVLVADDPLGLFDLDSGTWTATGKQITPAMGSATLLLDGTVLFAGGTEELGSQRATASAGLYIPAGLTPPPAVAALPTPTPTPVPTPTPTPPPVPTPVPPEAGPVPPGGWPWKVTVVNKSAQPTTLFVADEMRSGFMGRLVGTATPNVVPPGATVEVTFLLPAKGVKGWSIFVNPGPDTGNLVGSNDVPLPGQIHITPDGQVGWLSP